MDFETNPRTLTDSTLTLRRIRARAPRVGFATLALLALLTTTFLGLSTAAAAPAQAAAKNTPEEIAMWRAINVTRRSAGLAPLKMSIHLTKPARSWSGNMDRRNRLYHNSSVKYQVPLRWARLAENVGTYKYRSGKSDAVRRLHRAFMNSSGHRRNILGDHNVVGVGIRSSGGQMWVTVNFAKVK